MRDAGQVLHTFDSGLQGVAFGLSSALAANRAAHRDDAARARPLFAQAARLRATRLALLAAQDASAERDEALSAALLARRIAARRPPHVTSRHTV